MKPRSFTLVFLLVITQIVFAQKRKKNVAEPIVVNPYTAVDKKALELPDSLTVSTNSIADYMNASFTADSEKVRAIWIWIASNIQYDIDNLFAINFYEKEEEKIAKPLKTRKGICENYATLFNDICLKSGIKSYVIVGYTKQNGFTDYLPHAWNAAFVDSSWYIFDATWGSGHIYDGKFFKQINNTYYKADPAKIIRTHMPFDFLWQFSNYPVSNQEFYDGKTQINSTKPFYAYPDSIKLYESQSHIDQLTSTAERIERNGIKHALTYDMLRHVKMEIEQYRQQQIIDSFNTAVADMNEGVNIYNSFVQYRNKQFTPKKTDAEIKSMIDGADDKVKAAQARLERITTSDNNQRMSINQVMKSINDISGQIKEQQDWLKTYLSKGKSDRKMMFYERIW